MFGYLLAKSGSWSWSVSPAQATGDLRSVHYSADRSTRPARLDPSVAFRNAAIVTKRLIT
jgi:hypothetical protein